MTPASSQTAPTPSTFRSRGVFYLPGRVRCPLAGVGGRGDHDSNRLVLDGGQTEVTVDRAAARITVHDAHRYVERAVVCDLAFLAEGITAAGRRTPLCVHLKIMKSNDRFSLDLHRHLRTQEPLVAIEIEPFEVVVNDGVRARVVLDARRVERLACRPSLALRVLKSIMTMRDHRREAEAAAQPTLEGPPVADLSLGFGVLGLRWMMARARLTSPSARDSALFRSGSVAELLAGGAWTLTLTALSRHWLPEVVKRDLFLFGLDHLPLLDGVKAHGLRKGESLQFGFDGGRGEVVLGEQRAPLPGALDVARAYLEFHMLGGLLCEQVESERTAAAVAVA